MEFVAIKRNRGRKRRRYLEKRRREQIKFEVKTAKHTNIFIAKKKLITNTMHANSFWENYTAAQEWQRRHSVTWWKTRCTALEHENQVLRDKLRSLACENTQQYSLHPQKNQDATEEQYSATSTEENENLEFHVDEDMMNFLEQSMRHKIELQKKRESESCVENKLEDMNEHIQGGAAWIQARNQNAKLLYGEASPTILAMETALQTTVDRHKDKAKPQYWPIIPLKP
ncbi:uncharacterized protein F10E9.5-like [Osmia bicornis bicornis]|uniref:uncharacterized protein F10E9.5-like n=1 Tax=Osmia bicornis bicornis TaxID=1437191 RepID=UPI0010F486E1|nr:uncharacterized protein F10E9.5-like [Osmia bicornis bicornis]